MKRWWCVAVGIACAAWGSTSEFPYAEGPFRPDLASLAAYRCPDWFRDAKFGIWSHWGPQAVPERGDWYARKMYQEGTPVYRDHLERWGHPSKHGYKDLLPLWRAERWDPDRLMALYRRAGARYFVSMASHHDNFFLWDSALHRWTSVRVGPQRDVVGEWQAAARRHGMKFGVSEHLGASFTWFQVAHGMDTSGPLAGVRYDGAHPEFQDLYHWPADPDDTGWYSRDPRWHRRWYAVIRELVDRYQPDLLYTDGGVPFGPGRDAAGLSMIAHFYNSSAARHGGVPQVVYTCKQRGAEGRWVEDIERGVMPTILPHPWQTDTSIGDWYYNRDWKYRPVRWVIHLLVDIVSKNGNLLLNVVQRPDGSLDPEVEQQLEDLAQWFDVHGEAIYGTRPWAVYGEGPTRVRGGGFKEDFAFGPADVRFTTKGQTLYAIALGWPTNGLMVVRSLARAAGEIHQVELLGGAAPPAWRQTESALEVDVPTTPLNPWTCALRIRGVNLRPAPVPVEPTIVAPDRNGAFRLDPDDADLHGERLRVESYGSHANIGYWDRADEFAVWRIRVPTAGVWRVVVEAATVHEGSGWAIEAAGQTLRANIPPTRAWDVFRTFEAGRLRVETAGVYEVRVRPLDAATWRAINLRSVRLTPVK
ncbi:MAG: alpha-L-fucosidase [Kiritimatiellae bacterium]|nr:alpha-L-fucosidase [Kiritimatiellia bacterium]